MVLSMGAMAGRSTEGNAVGHRKVEGHAAMAEADVMPRHAAGWIPWQWQGSSAFPLPILTSTASSLIVATASAACRGGCFPGLPPMGPKNSFGILGK